MNNFSAQKEISAILDRGPKLTEFFLPIADLKSRGLILTDFQTQVLILLLIQSK